MTRRRPDTGVRRWVEARYPDGSEAVLSEGPFDDDAACLAYAAEVETTQAKGWLAQHNGQRVDMPLAVSILAYITSYPYVKGFYPSGAAILANAHVSVPVVASEDVHDYRTPAAKHIRHSHQHQHHTRRQRSTLREITRRQP